MRRLLKLNGRRASAATVAEATSPQFLAGATAQLLCEAIADGDPRLVAIGRLMRFGTDEVYVRIVL